MEKVIRNAVRCFVIEDEKVLVTRYKLGNKKEGYLEIPGGKIEDGETSKSAAVREVKEETNIDVEKENLIYKGKLKVEYENRIYFLDIYFTNKYFGSIKDTEEFEVYFMDIENIRKEKKKLSNLILLEKEYINYLFDKESIFNMEVFVDEDENIIDIKFELESN